MTKAEKKAIASRTQDLIKQGVEKEIAEVMARTEMVTKEVKFYWWRSYKIWRVSGADIEEITRKAAAMSDKYHAIHFEVL